MTADVQYVFSGTMPAVAPASPRPRTAQRSAAPRPIRARYDAAQTTDENKYHWAAADALSADAANSPGVRQRLRNRARYEVANNCYAKGLVLTIANDEIGVGPTLQVPVRGIGPQVEAAWREWSEAVGLAAKLRTMVQSRVTDGEAFLLLVDNPRLDNPVTLDLRPIEADQVASPMLGLLEPNRIDGLRFDDLGNPVEYEVLDEHPGGPWPVFDPTPRRIPARFMLHLFRADRPGQHRGIPELTPALGLFAQLRRYTEAVIAAAETAADMAILLKSTAPAAEDDEDPEPFDLLEYQRRMMLTLPKGLDAFQVDPKQPSQQYGEFKREILNEIARCVNVPFNVAAGNSSSYNYASGRLDHQVYFRSLGIDQGAIELVVLSRIFRAWWAEAVRHYRWPVADLAPPIRQWFWPALSHVDPRLVAEAREVALRCGLTSPVLLAAEDGLDYDLVRESAARSYGITVEEYAALVRQKTFGGLAPQQQPQPAKKPDANDTEDGSADPDTSDEETR